jgi:hypothetical protein
MSVEDEHHLTIREWLNDHKRGLSMPVCSCGWEGPIRYTSRTFWDEIRYRMLREWREHLPADWPLTCETRVEDDGSITTGQAYVTIEGQDYMLMALSTRLTPVALIVNGFWSGEDSGIEDAEEFVIPAGRVLDVRSHPWYELRDIDEEAMPEPANSEELLH